MTHNKESDNNKHFCKIRIKQEQEGVGSVQARSRGAREVAKELCEAAHSTIGALISNPYINQYPLASVDQKRKEEEEEERLLITMKENEWNRD